jgi:hypothetical protein
MATSSPRSTASGRHHDTHHRAARFHETHYSGSKERDRQRLILLRDAQQAHRSDRLQRRDNRGARTIEHLAQVAIEAEMVRLPSDVIIPFVNSAFRSGAAHPADPAAETALGLLLDDLAWWSAAPTTARTQGELPRPSSEQDHRARTQRRPAVRAKRSKNQKWVICVPSVT